jgi:hypothetical protein
LCDAAHSILSRVATPALRAALEGEKQFKRRS